MPGTDKFGWFLGGLAGGVLLGKALKDKPLADGEDRPPIIVSGGSLTIKHEKGWARRAVGNRNWKSAHAQGRNVNGFAVIITDPSVPFGYSGTSVSVVFESKGVQNTFAFSVFDEQPRHIPVVDGSVDLELPSRDVLLYNFDGVITGLLVNGTPVGVIPKTFELWMY